MMNRKKRYAFRPLLGETRLEERIVLSGSTAAVAVTPAPAPPPVYAPVIAHARPWKTANQLRAAYDRQVKIAAVDLPVAMERQVQEAYANGSTPTAQQLANLNAGIQGAVDATALGLSSQASLLPASGARLVPAIQNSLVGSGANSLASLVNGTFQSSKNTQTAAKLQSALTRDMLRAPIQVTGQINRFFATNNLNQLAVNSSGQQIPLSQFMGQQVISQLSNTLGSLAKSFPSVATSMLFPNGVTTTPSQDLTNSFNSQVTNALDTAAFQLGSSLAMLNGSSNVVSQLQPLLFGSATNSSGLASVLQNLTAGTGSSSGLTGTLSSDLSSAVTNALNTGMSNLVAPLSSFLSVQEPSKSYAADCRFYEPLQLGC